MVYLLFWIISMAMVGGSRLLYRIAVTRERFTLLRAPRDDVRRVMVVGAGWAGASVVHEMQRGSYGNRVPVLVVDDDRIRTGSELSGVPVVRGSGNILKLASDYRVDEIIIAIATPWGDLKPLIESAWPPAAAFAASRPCRTWAARLPFPAPWCATSTSATSWAAPRNSWT